jgi:hypothetical protein
VAVDELDGVDGDGVSAPGHGVMGTQLSSRGTGEEKREGGQVPDAASANVSSG